jgi:hypothetical protein
MKTLEKIVKTSALAVGIGLGILGFNKDANAQCNQPLANDEHTVALYHLDENQGNVTYIDTKGLENKFRGIINSNDLWTSGAFGSGLKFNDYSFLYQESQYVPRDTAKTFEAYIKPENYISSDTTNSQGIVVFNQFAFGIDNEGKLCLRMSCLNSSLPPSIIKYEEFHGNNSVELNKWSYVAFTYNGGNEIDLYINGNLDKRYFSFNSSLSCLSITSIGSWGNKAHFHGTIDEARISDIKREFIPCTITDSKPTTWGKLKSIYR